MPDLSLITNKDSRRDPSWVGASEQSDDRLVELRAAPGLARRTPTQAAPGTVVAFRRAATVTVLASFKRETSRGMQATARPKNSRL